MATRQRRRWRRLFAGVGLLTVLTWPAHAQGTQAAAGPATPSTSSTPAPTLFGHGPELYTSPTMLRPGMVATVIGLGLPPGARVGLSALDPTAGCSKMCPFVARTVVAPDGRLRVTFIAQAYPSAYPWTPLILTVWRLPTGQPLTRTTLVLAQHGA